MLQVTVESKSVISGLSRLIKNLEFTKPLKEAKKTLDTETRRNFDLQGYIYAGSWKPLSQATRDQRAREGYGSARPILVRTGKFRSSFKGDVKKETLTYENTSKLAPYHQFGTNKMPARKVLGISDKFRMAVTKMVVNHLADTIRKYYG